MDIFPKTSPAKIRGVSIQKVPLQGVLRVSAQFVELIVGQPVCCFVHLTFWHIEWSFLTIY